MMTYLKHVGNFKHSELKTKKFEEIQALYEKIKRSDEDFISIGSAEDERLIKRMNEKGIDSFKNKTIKEEDKEEEGTKKRKGGHIKMIARKKKRSQSDVDSDDEHKKMPEDWHSELSHGAEALRKEFAKDTKDLLLQAGATKACSTNTVNTASTPVSTASPYGGVSFTDLTNTNQDDSEIPALEEIYDNPTDGIFANASYDDEGRTAAIQDFKRIRALFQVTPKTFHLNAVKRIFRYITAIIAGKPVTNSEASIRSDLHFDDADGIDSLPNQAIFDAIQLMGQSKLQPIPSPTYLSIDQHETETDPSLSHLPTTHILDSIPEGFGGNHRDQAKKIKHLKAQIKKLKKKAKPVITHHRAWMKSGRKSAKAEPTIHKDQAFDELDDDAIDNMETKDSQDMGRTRYVMHEEKEREEKEVSTEDALGTDKEEVSTDRPDEGTDKSKVSTNKEKDSTDRPDEVLLNMSQAKAVLREKEKGVELKDIENIERPRLSSTRSLLTLKHLLKIDPKDKGKKKIEEDESDTESEDINKTEKKKRLAEEEAINAALIQDFDDIKVRIEADRLLALRLQEEERESKQRAAAIRNRPPTRTQLRSQMMTYLKHVGNKKHSDLKNKTFEEIQALYEKVKRFDESFNAVGSTEDERKIKEMNEGAKDPEQKRLKKRVVKETSKNGNYLVTKKRKSGHVKMIARKRPRPQPDDDNDDEHIKCLRIVTFEGTIDSEIMETKSFIARLHKVSSPDGNYLVVYRVNVHFRAFNYLMEEVDINKKT
ncbi:hypothetical protein Tco_0826233, partial [Tanacetum coccineum]